MGQAGTIRIDSVDLQKARKEKQEKAAGYNDMESMFASTGEAICREGTICESAGLGSQVRFCNSGHEKAFEALTPRQKEYIAAYIRTGSATAVLSELGLSGSVSQVSKRLGQISRAMGCADVRELRGSVESNENKASASELKEIIEGQRYLCALTGRPLTPRVAEVDHKVSIRKGGDNSKANLQWLHKQVNRAKGTMSQSDFIAMCCEVAAIHGQKSTSK